MKLKSFSTELEGGWTGMTWSEENSTELLMQQNVTKLEVRLSDGSLVEGENITVTCAVEGGVPLPSVGFMLMKTENNTNMTRVENSSERFTNITELPLSPDGKVQTVSALLRLRKEDQGRHVGCRAEQWDRSEPRVSLASKDDVRQFSEEKIV